MRRQAFACEFTGSDAMRWRMSAVLTGDRGMGLILVVAFVRDDEDDMTTYQGASRVQIEISTRHGGLEAEQHQLLA